MMQSGAEPVERLLLDTSAYSHLRTGHKDVLDRVAAATAVLMPVIVVGELEAAFAAGTRPHENRASLEEFLAEAFVSVVPVTRSVAHRYGELFGQLRRAGTPIPVNDIWIAAIAIEQRRELLTFDWDFARVPDLRAVILATDPPLVR
jgi:tRNA(fMet)-specific endonuclease VapC